MTAIDYTSKKHTPALDVNYQEHESNTIQHGWCVNLKCATHRDGIGFFTSLCMLTTFLTFTCAVHYGGRQTILSKSVYIKCCGKKYKYVKEDCHYITCKHECHGHRLVKVGGLIRLCHLT